MSFPVSLPSLPNREAITDALYRAVLGFDTGDTKLFDSAFFPEATFELNGQIMNGLKEIYSDCFDNISKLDTTHFMSNVRVSHVDDSATKASLTASALAQHYRTGEGMKPGSDHLMSGSLYFVDVAKDGQDGLWKVKSWKMKLIWTDGDFGVISGN